MEYSRAQLEARVDGMLCELFEMDKSELKPSANLFTDLGLDSLDAIDLVICFQRELKIKPENSDLQAIRTLADVYDLVHRYYQKTSNAG